MNVKTQVEDLAYVRFSAPDLSAMAAFLTDFGMVVADGSTENILFMRGADGQPVFHITEKGDPGFLGVGLRAASVQDVRARAASEGLDTLSCAAPGGGEFVRLFDPDGFAVDVIAGQVPCPEHAAGDRRNQWNSIGSRPRHNRPKRLAAGPAHAVRLGHAVFLNAALPRTWAWWESRFNLRISDEVFDEDGNLVALFVRFDLGDRLTDHHSLNFSTSPDGIARFHHAAFEVLDLDDLAAGHEFLAERQHRHDWGVGRHILGSQVFDYWRDPWGHRLEHWTDGDVYDDAIPPLRVDLSAMLGCHWGPLPPADFA